MLLTLRASGNSDLEDCRDFTRPTRGEKREGHTQEQSPSPPPPPSLPPLITNGSENNVQEERGDARKGDKERAVEDEGADEEEEEGQLDPSDSENANETEQEMREAHEDHIRGQKARASVNRTRN